MDKYSELMDIILKGLKATLKCPICDNEIPYLSTISTKSHLNCMACDWSLKKLEFCCPKCDKIVLESTFCEHCGFNKPEWVTKLLEFYK